MDSSKRKKLETRLRELCQAEEYRRAAELALDGYGPEIRKMLQVALKDPCQVDDVYGMFSEAVLTSLPGFRWESSFRTWVYGVARNTCMASFRSARTREQPVADDELGDRPVLERTATQPWLRTEVKNRFKALQERLSPHEQQILELRVEGRLPWTEVARVMAGRELSPEELEKRASVLRHQFQRIKTRLRALAVDEELLQPASH
jgi:RNA polymerase sigma-70 factor, ECF subfamily